MNASEKQLWSSKKLLNALPPNDIFCCYIQVDFIIFLFGFIYNTRLSGEKKMKFKS